MEGLLPSDPATIGPYRLVGRIGSGGMGVVYQAEDDKGTQVAVKLIWDELAQDPLFGTPLCPRSASRTARGRYAHRLLSPSVSGTPGASGAMSPWTSVSFTWLRYDRPVTGGATDSPGSAGITGSTYVSHDGARCASGPSSALNLRGRFRVRARPRGSSVLRMPH